MAIINCPECGAEVSDKAPACVNCGYPIESRLPYLQEPDARKPRGCFKKLIFGLLPSLFFVGMISRNCQEMEKQEREVEQSIKGMKQDRHDNERASKRLEPGILTGTWNVETTVYKSDYRLTASGSMTFYSSGQWSSDSGGQLEMSDGTKRIQLDFLGESGGTWEITDDRLTWVTTYEDAPKPANQRTRELLDAMETELPELKRTILEPSIGEAITIQLVKASGSVLSFRSDGGIPVTLTRK